MTECTEEMYKKQFYEVIELFRPTMDDFLYVFDFIEDEYYISSSAAERFRLPGNKFSNTAEVFKELVHPADIDCLMSDLGMIKQGKKGFHDLEYRWIDKEGNPVWINCRGCVIEDKKGISRYIIGCINEIGKSQKADNISGLQRETKFQQKIERMQDNELRGYILRFGIDKFKDINENMGTEYGDMILRKTAECIQEMLPADMELYRIMSDEFVVADFSRGDITEAEEIYKQIQQRIDRFIEENGYEVFYTLSAGILGISELEDKSYVNLMRLSEFALSRAKSRGRNQYYIYNSDDYATFVRQKLLLNAMRKAINNNYEGFEAYFQPVVDIKQNRICGAETLLRFKSAEIGFVSPVEFIPILEESNLIIPVGKWVLDQATSACNKIQKRIPNFKVSVNLSYVQAAKSNVLSDIETNINKYQLASGSIIIELTESGMLEMSAIYQQLCEGMKRMNVSLALDDFGTGYSNFHYLYRLSPDTIKIDRSFTWNALQNEHDYKLLKHMVDMSHSIGMKLCIEGIETDEELNKISEMGPDFIQGYYFGKPCDFNQFCEAFV